MIASLLALLLGLPGSPGSHPARFWGVEGHRVVAGIAADRLTPRAASEAARLLHGASLPTISTWADEVRSQRPETGPWHYVNIPVIDSAYDAAKECPGGACILGALDRQLALLADRKQSDSVRSEALKWVVHLIGDLHQPLHVGDRGDRGGNDVKLTWFGRSSNLHSVWDSGILSAMGMDDVALRRELEGRLAQRNDLATIERGTPLSWAMESHDAARDVAYRFLPPSLDLGQDYLDAARPTVEERLLRAGVRLAAVLNQALGS